MNNKKSYKVVSFVPSQTKNGKEMWRIGLREEGTENVLTGVIWSEDIPRFDGTKFKVGNDIKFLGQDYNSNYNSVVIKNVTVLKEALSGLPKGLEEECLTELNDFLTYVIGVYEQGSPLSLLAKELESVINSQLFAITPAAEKHHHNYLGGLLKHTHEVYSIILQLGLMFHIENIDELRLAAILHDAGKMFEYETDTKLGTAAIDKDWMHREFSHILWGTTLAQKCGAFSIARMVASHHGKLEWGALIEPETPEEKALHLADMLSAATGITSIEKLELFIENSTIPEPSIQEDKKEEETHACENDRNVL